MEDDDRRSEDAADATVDANDQPPAPGSWTEDDEDDDGGNGEELDPRVQDELEALNSAAESINRLENEVQRARAKFRLMKAESTQRLQALSKKISRKWIIKARPYYDLLVQSQKAQLEAQRSAIKFQKANSFYTAAKETVTLAEQQVVTDDGTTVVFSSAWQEMLNHATMKFMDAEKEKAACELDHEQKAKDYANIQQKLAFLQKDMPRTIFRSKAFYELKDVLQSRLQAERQNAEDLHLALICSKQKYKMALNSLENISEEVHRSRQLRMQVPLWRTPGVGAESDNCSEMSDMPSLGLDFMSETASQVSFDDFAEDGSWSPQLDVDLTLDDDLQEPEPLPVGGGGGGETQRKLSDVSQHGLGQIWARLGNNLTRMTLEMGRKSSTGDRLDLAGTDSRDMIRDDTVDGAEDQRTSEQTAKEMGRTTAQRRVVRSKSCERLVVQQMSVVNLGALDPTQSASRDPGKPPIPSSPRRMSVSSLKSGVYVTQPLALPEKSDPRKAAPLKPGTETASQQFPILYELKSSNQKTLATYKPVSFLQSIQARGNPVAPSKATPNKKFLANKADGKSTDQSNAKTAGGSKSESSNMKIKDLKGEEIFV